MLASFNPRVLEISSRVDIIEILMEYGTLQETMWIGREAEFSDYGHDNMNINILRLEVYNFVGTEILRMTPSELCDA
jgi:hypothetical protein